ALANVDAMAWLRVAGGVRASKAMSIALIVFVAVAARASETPVVAATTASAAQRAFYATPFERTPSVAELTALGHRMFFDRGLSASGKLSCATCHDPRHAYGPVDSMPTPRGGLDGSKRGFRAAPSLRYLQNVPAFTEHMHDADGDDGIDQGPAGGRT